MNYIIINDKILPEENALISVKERGFRFGDGVFESCKISAGKIYNSENHLRRLEAGCDAIKINFNFPNLKKSAEELIAKNKIQNGVLRISVSRGVGSQGYLPVKNIQPLLVIETEEKIFVAPKSVNLWISKYQKVSAKSLPVNFKLMQGLNSTLAKIEAEENNSFDTLLLNSDGEICETSSANIFWVKNDVLFTPNATCGLLLGTTREKIISLSPLPVKLVKAQLENLLEAEEIFITNSFIGVLGIDKIFPNRWESKEKKYCQIFSELLEKDIL